MTSHTDQLAMARRIAADALCGPEKWKPGVMAGMYEEIMRGDADTEALVQGPLAAIIETTERAAKIVKEYAGEAQDSYHRCLGMNAAEALECGDHLKGQS